MVTQPNATLPTHPHAPQEVEIDLGELVAQGGFHSNFQLLGVRSRDTNQWLLNQAEASISSQLAPPPPLTTKLLRRGSSNTSPGATAGSGLGLCYRRKGRRKSISGLDQMPPIPKSVKITMFAPFENHDNEMSRKGRRRGRRLTKSKSSWDINKTFEEDSGRQRQQEYVLKCLSYKTLQCPELKEQGLKDMQAEISMLRRFSHPGFHGAGTMTLEGFEDGVEYPIILLDRLNTTLDEKIEEWKAAQKKVTFAGRLPGNLNNRQRESCGHLYFERLGLVVNIAKALDYLHYQKIIFRALNPENIGFDRHDNVQLKNFGSAKDLTQAKQFGRGLYRLTGLTGSFRYMAPEVALEKPYNETADVYSLGIIIWQIMALKVPFGKYSVKKMYQRVFKAPHARPSLIGLEGVADGWLPLLLDHMWSPVTSYRYTTDQVVTFLDEEVKELAERHFELATGLLKTDLEAC